MPLDCTNVAATLYFEKGLCSPGRGEVDRKRRKHYSASKEGVLLKTSVNRTNVHVSSDI